MKLNGIKMENKLKPLQLQSFITGIKSMTSSWRIQIDTMENISPDKIAYMAGVQNKAGWFTFNVHQIEAEDIVDLPQIKTKEKKSKSQKLREVLFRLWETSWKSTYDEFQDFYDFYMEQIIDKIKGRL